MKNNIKWNLNYCINFKPTKLGLFLLVDKINNIMPKEHHTCYKDQKAKLNDKGELRLQFHQFLNYFGGLGIGLQRYIKDFHVVLEQS